MITVKLRHTDSGVAMALYQVDDVDKVIPMLRRWGVECGGNVYGNDEELTGQFVLTDNEAYFEVVVGAYE